MSNASPVSIASALPDVAISTSDNCLTSVMSTSSSSSRRRKGNPKKCPQSTVNLTIESPPCSSDSSNTSIGADDSGFSSSLNSLLSGFAPPSKSDVQQLQAVLQKLEYSDQASNALSMLASNSSMGLPATVSSASKPPPSTVNSFGPPSPKKPRIKGSRRQSEDPANVTLPEGFETLLEKARSEGSSASNPHGLPPYAYTPRNEYNDNGAPLKRLRNNRSDTKITLQGPDGSIIEEQYDAEELQNFVKHFKILRNKYGFTQGDVGAALGRRYGADFSQTTISRFEALNLSYKNMCKLRPLLEEWLEEIDSALETGTSVSDLLSQPHHPATAAASRDSVMSNYTSDDQCSVSPDHCISPVVTASAVAAKLGVAKIMPPLKKRRKRTNLDASQKLALDAYFDMNPRPDFTQITEIGHNLKLDNDVVRVWFCNRRQKMRRIDPLKSESPTLV